MSGGGAVRHRDTSSDLRQCEDVGDTAYFAVARYGAPAVEAADEE
jgi:hypothetical protein